MVVQFQPLIFTRKWDQQPLGEFCLVYTYLVLLFPIFIFVGALMDCIIFTFETNKNSKFFGYLIYVLITNRFKRTKLKRDCMVVTMEAGTYLHQMDESGEDGTAQHVVFFRLLPQQRKVLN